MYHQKLQWKTDYHLKAKMVAKAFQQRYIRVCVAGKLQDVLGEQNDFQRQLQAQENMGSVQQVTGMIVFKLDVNTHDGSVIPVCLFLCVSGIGCV